jgi:hypothetical protein
MSLDSLGEGLPITMKHLETFISRMKNLFQILNAPDHPCLNMFSFLFYVEYFKWCIAK